MTQDGRLALRIAALCVVEFVSPPFERLNIFVYLFQSLPLKSVTETREHGLPLSASSSISSNKNPPESFQVSEFLLRQMADQMYLNHGLPPPPPHYLRGLYT